MVSLSTSISESLVDDIVVSYYKDIYRQLSKGENLHVDVPNLGIFSIKPWSLKRKLEKMDAQIKNLRKPRSMQSYAIHKEKLDRLEHLHILQEKVDEEILQKKRIKLLRAEYEESTSNDLGE